MNKQEVDARVQRAVENLRAGRTVEDDAGIECKAEWPEFDTKTRQLAGAANALRGNALIYVIGVDDKTGEITTPAKRDAQEWYAQIRKPFDQIAPELLWAQTVYLADGVESVQALVFDTSEYPYVVNIKDATDRREVPIRVGSGTGSAHRNQIVRMFDPSTALPNFAVTEASVSATWTDTPRPVADVDPIEIERILELDATVRARVFIEYTGSSAIALPVRGMRARLRCGDLSTHLKVGVWHPGQGNFLSLTGDRQPVPPTPRYGVYARDQHVIATAPGEFTVMSNTDFRKASAPNEVMSDLYDLFSGADEMFLDLVLRVVGNDLDVKLTAHLLRDEPVKPEEERAGSHGSAVTIRLGRWQLPEFEDDPWGDGL